MTFNSPLKFLIILKLNWFKGGGRGGKKTIFPPEGYDPVLEMFPFHSHQDQLKESIVDIGFYNIPSHPPPHAKDHSCLSSGQNRPQVAFYLPKLNHEHIDNRQQWSPLLCCEGAQPRISACGFATCGPRSYSLAPTPHYL